MKQVFSDSIEFRSDVLNGIKKLAAIVQVTLGPGGRAVLLETENAGVMATKDGVTVARHFAGTNPVQKLVAQAAVEASERTVRSCGDGTTTSLVLAAAIVEAGQEWLIKNPKYSPQRLSRDLKDTFNQTISPMLTVMAKPIRDLSEEEGSKAVWNVAMVSSNADISIADAVTKAVQLVGEDGMITVEEGAGGLDTTVEHKAGFPSNSGLSDLGGAASSAFVNRKNYGDTLITGSYIALYDGDINDIESLVPLLERVSKEQDDKGMPARHPLIIVAHGFGDQILRALSQNFRQNILTVVPFVTPRNGQANGRQQFIYDLQSYVGGQVFEPQGNPIFNAAPATIGFCEEVKIGLNESVFITSPDEEAISNRIEELKTQMEGTSEFDKDRIRYRIGQLTGGVAAIFAGGATALEAKERRDRVVDAVSAVRSAMDLGVVPGGGAALLHVSRNLSETGFNQILSKALTKPFVQILINAGVATDENEAMYIAERVGQREDGNFYVYDALKNQEAEFWTSGIFDPAKVTISALLNALSVAQLLMTTGGAIANSDTSSDDNMKAMQKAFENAMNNGENT